MGILTRSDPIRIIQAVITGVSFLGAGTIIRRSSTRQVEGLTTAASILFAAAVHAARCGPMSSSGWNSAGARPH